TVISYGDLLFRSYVLRDLADSGADFTVIVDSSPTGINNQTVRDFAYCSRGDDRGLFGTPVLLEHVDSEARSTFRDPAGPSVEAARVREFGWYAGVPCSYLTPFINYVLQDSSLRYLSMANEGDAVALIAGVALGGGAHGIHGRGITMMQNSGLGNAVSPLTSL